MVTFVVSGRNMFCASYESRGKRRVLMKGLKGVLVGVYAVHGGPLEGSAVLLITEDYC